jgi:dipeptide/tripeptide permease
MGEIARTLIFLGAVLIVIGLVILGIQKFPFVGKLPGDIIIKRENFTFYFPLATGIIVSILISLILYLIGKFR